MLTGFLYSVNFTPLIRFPLSNPSTLPRDGSIRFVPFIFRISTSARASTSLLAMSRNVSLLATNAFFL